MLVPMVIVLGIALFPVLLYAIVKEPYYLALAFLLFVYFRLHELSPVFAQTSIIQILVLLTLAAFFLHIFLGNIKIYWTDELKLFLLFFIAVSVGVAFSHDRAQSYSEWVDNFSKIGVITLIIAWTINKPQVLGASIKLFILAGILVACVVLYNQAHGIDVILGDRVTVGRSWGSKLEDPNDLGLILLFPMGFMIAGLLTRGAGFINRTFSLCGLGLMFPAMMATGSRGSMVGLAAVITAFVFQRLKKVKMKWALFLTVLTAVLIKTIAIMIGSGFRVSGLDESTEGRVNAWKAGFNMAVHHPFFGVGLGNFSDLHSLYGVVQSSLTAHSIWFQIMGECGFVGFTIYVLMVGVMLFKSYKVLDKLRLKCKQDPTNKSVIMLYISAQAIFIGLVGFCASGTFLSQAWDWPFYVYLGLSAAIQHIVATQYQDISAIRLPAFMAKLLRHKYNPIPADNEI